MCSIFKCGTGSFYRAALFVAVIDILITSVLLVMLVLGTTVLIGFQFIRGNAKNATNVLEEITDDVFGSPTFSYYTTREAKEVAEDLGVFLIITFLSIVDFVISCIFLDGVKSRIQEKCQVWFNIRLVIIVVFLIIIGINLACGVSLSRSIPDVVISMYRIIGLLIGYAFIRELRLLKAQEKCLNCGVTLSGPTPSISGSVINLSGKRKEAEDAFRKTSSSSAPLPILMITGPDDHTLSGSNPTLNFINSASYPGSPSVSSSRKSSSSTLSELVITCPPIVHPFSTAGENSGIP